MEDLVLPPSGPHDPAPPAAAAATLGAAVAGVPPVGAEAAAAEEGAFLLERRRGDAGGEAASPSGSPPPAHLAGHRRSVGGECACRNFVRPSWMEVPSDPVQLEMLRDFIKLFKR